MGRGSVDSSSAWVADWSPHFPPPVGACGLCFDRVQQTYAALLSASLMYSNPLFLGGHFCGRWFSASPGARLPSSVPGWHCLQWALITQLSVPLTADLTPAPFADALPTQFDFGSFVMATAMCFPNVPNSCIGGSGTTTKGEHIYFLHLAWLDVEAALLASLLWLGTFSGQLGLSLWGIAALSILRLVMFALPGRRTPLFSLLLLPARGIPPSAVCAIGLLGSLHGPVNWQPWKDRKGRMPRVAVRTLSVPWGCLRLLCILSLPCQVWAVPSSYREAVQACQALASVLPDSFEDVSEHSPHGAVGRATSTDSWALPPPVVTDRSTCRAVLGATLLRRDTCTYLDSTEGPWLGTILHCPFYQQQTWAIQVAPGLDPESFFDNALSYTQEAFHPHIDSLAVINPQRHDGYAMLLRYPSALDHLPGRRQVAVILDLSRVGGHYHASIIPANITHDELQARVRMHVFCDVDSLDVYVAATRTPWSFGAIPQLDHGDVLTVVARGGCPPFLHFFDDLFKEDSQWGSLEHIPRRILTPAVHVLRDEDPFTLVGHHFPRMSLQGAIAQVLQADEANLAFATSWHFGDFDDSGAPCDRCVAVHRWPQHITASEAAERRLVFTFVTCGLLVDNPGALSPTASTCTFLRLPELWTSKCHEISRCRLRVGL